MTVFTEQQFTAAFQKVLDKFGPDHVYKRPKVSGHSGMCRYAHEDGTPDCLIGQILHVLDEENGTHVMPDFHTLNGANTVLGRLVPEEVAEAGQNAQYVQDSGRPWGEAYERYQRVLSRHSAEADPVVITNPTLTAETQVTWTPTG